MKKILLSIVLLATLSVAHSQNLGLKWAKQFDSVNDLWLTDIESDANDNVYIIGQFSATTDMDPGAGVSNIYALGDEDIFVAKYTSQGSFVWVKTFGGFGLEMANSIAVNDYGDVAILFQTENYIDLDPSTPNNELTFSGDGSVLLWLSSDGQLLSGRSWNGTVNTQDNSNQIAIDNAGNTFMFGTPDHKFIKYDYFFNIAWEKTIDIINAESIVVDDYGDVYLASAVYGSGYLLPNDFVGYYSVAGTNWDILVSKFDTFGSLIWQGNVGSNNQDANARLETDGLSKLFLTYETEGAVESSILSVGWPQPYYGSWDVVLSCYDLDGAEQWTNVLGTASPEYVTALTYQPLSSEIFLGTYIYPGFDGDPTAGTTPNAGPIYSYHSANGAIASWGDHYLVNTFNAGSVAFHYSPYLKALSDGTFIAGDRFTTNLDVTPGAAVDYLSAPNFVYDIFLAKYGQCQPTSSVVNVTICENESYTYEGQNLTAGNYEYHFANAGGCDSLVTLNVSQWQTTTVYRNVAACSSPYVYHGTSITTTGNYAFEWPNANGCNDSIVNLYVYFITTPTLSVSGAGNNYFITASGANLNGNYIFINCDNNQIVQQGSSAVYNTSNTGNYMVHFVPTQFSGNGCFVATPCVHVGTVGVSEVDATSLTLFPNPIGQGELLQIQSGEEQLKLITVYDVSGRRVYSSSQVRKSIGVDELGLSPGQYTFVLTSDQHSYHSKLVVR